MDKKALAKEFYEHLTTDLIPFWAGLKDDENGGYYGQVDFDHALDKKADKGCILNSRILWFFSSAAMLFRDLENKKLNLPQEDSETASEKNDGPEKRGSAGEYRKYAELCMEQADHAYDFLMNAFIDRENGGVFWAVTYDGKPSDTLKHTYCHAFAIYALAAYFDASGKKEAFDTAMELADLIESRCTDDIGYLEAFNCDFTPARNDELSENGVMADKTMNTLLHVFEAYTELLRVIKKHFPTVAKGGFSKENADMAAKIANRMKFVLDIFAEKIYNSKLRRQEVFFDREYKPIIDLHSYGPDIETSWLMDRGLEVLSDVEYTNEIEPLTLSLAERIYERAYVNHSLLNECENGVDDKRRIWWVQAETVIGFMHASGKIQRKKDRVNLTMKASGASAKERQETAVEAERRAANFFMASLDVWEFIRDKQTDRRIPGGAASYLPDGCAITGDNGKEHIPSEWYSELDENFDPIKVKNLVDAWKCPYHNGRMCLEMIRRLNEG